ncbi:5'-nucleotidase C-terminal domain-containing protein [Planococcus halocryophilus]|uniref:5'-nucleotidase C-terminal domain-containing protein n=1 Tax=Planococcus halocryophilus TaxID=1215089 RepID=UPI001F0CE4A7|nr:5'-nucleotidase C-terminal domain-containing protein [Planococcus halocryophilus]MCH4826836.1 5'-nucleotidase C-terminal domain-containing protein [Planococcus halocryophilus]
MTNVLYNKKFIASAVTVTMVASALSPVSANTTKFEDVSDRYMAAVDFLVENGITNGISETHYGTTDNIKRQDAAVMIARAIGFKSDQDFKDSGFTDVPASAKWAVDALVQAGIVHGKTETRFGSTDLLTRNELSKILASAAQYEIDDKVTKTQFTDVNTKFAKYVDALIKNEITVGKSKTQFGSEHNLTRGEMALFIFRAKEDLKRELFSVSLMHTNDTHGRLATAPKRVTAVKEFRAKNPDALLLDAGDVFSGTLYFNEFTGEPDMKMMNLMGYDAMTFGNHEFDLGSSEEGHQALKDFVKAAKFPFLSANTDFSDEPLFEGMFQSRISNDPDSGNIYSGMVKKINGEKVGIFGLTTEDTIDISSPGKVTFSNYIAEAQLMVDEFEKMGVDKVIALTHIGYDDNAAIDNDQELAKAVEGIDVIVGGHTHTELAKPILVEKFDAPTVIVQTGQYGDNLGTLDVQFDEKGEVYAYNGELIKISAQVEDPEAAEILAPYSARVKEIEEEETTAVATAPLLNPRSGDVGNTTGESVRRNETPLGNIITDGMLKKAREFSPETVMAFQNGGGIRTAIDAGPITVGEIIKVLPFGNTLATMDLTGTEIKQAFEISVGQYPNENGGFLHVSGAEIKFDASKPAGSRIVSITFVDASGAKKPLVESETYKVATNAFTAKGGDGYTVLAKAYAEGRAIDLGISDWINFQEELERIGQVTPKLEGRILEINTPQ